MQQMFAHLCAADSLQKRQSGEVGSIYKKILFPFCMIHRKPQCLLKQCSARARDEGDEIYLDSIMP